MFQGLMAPVALVLLIIGVAVSIPLLVGLIKIVTEAGRAAGL